MSREDTKLSKMTLFVYVPKNQINSENRKHTCEHYTDLEI